jgi:cation transport ATPase
MDDQTSPSSEFNDQRSSQPVYQDWREMRRAERAARKAEHRMWREERRAWRRSSGWAWTFGAILILIGVVFLLENTGALYFANAWALLLLFAIVGSFGAAWSMLQRGGQLNPPARSALVGGIVLTVIMVALLLSTNWGLILSVALILAGVAMLFNWLWPGS